MKLKRTLFVLLTSLFSVVAKATGLQVGATAPTFTLKNQAGNEFQLASRKGKWTILFFYPKAETPGCTKQACAFSDNLDKIRALGADVFGISINTIEEQKNFKVNQKLKIDLLADGDGKVTRLYGAKMPLLNMSNRWTFLIDPELKIRLIDREVDPVKDAGHMAEKLKEFQAKK